MLKPGFGLIAVGLIALGLMGCDTFNGVRRTVQVQELPSVVQARVALGKVTGMNHVELETVPAQSGLGLHGIERDPAYFQIVFNAREAGGVLEIQENARKQKTLSLYQMWINRHPTPAMVAKIRTLFDAVYTQLRRELPSLPPPDAVIERVYGVERAVP